MDFEPEHSSRWRAWSATTTAAKFHYLHVSHDETLGRYLRVMSALPDSPQADAFTAQSPIPAGPVELRVEVDYERLRFAYRLGGGAWTWLPQQFDASILSDEADRAGPAQFHRRLRRHGLPGHGGHGAATPTSTGSTIASGSSSPIRAAEGPPSSGGPHETKVHLTERRAERDAAPRVTLK